jgi:hypothetical protein
MIISVTPDRQLAFPQEVQVLLQPGDDYDVRLTVDGILLKKVDRLGNVNSLDLDESAKLYAELYTEDLELQELTSSAMVGWSTL